MNANINEDELFLLVYLHEHAKGFTEDFAVLPPTLRQKINMPEHDFNRAFSYLVSHGLMGYKRSEPSPDVSPSILGPRLGPIGLYMTALGEDYVRELEKQPGIAKKLTVKAFRGLWGAGKGIIVDVAAKILGDIMMGRHP